MSLYQAPTGDGTNFVKFNGKAGRWYVKKDGAEVEIQNPVFVADLANAKRAWMHFQEGMAPNVIYFPTHDAQVAKPSDNHKLGISVMLFSNQLFGGVVKLESNSINTCKAISDLYDLYTKSEESKKGMLPVVKVTGATPVKGNYGTNYAPQFVIEKYIPRPAEFDIQAEPAHQPAAQAAPIASSGSEF